MDGFFRDSFTDMVVNGIDIRSINYNRSIKQELVDYLNENLPDSITCSCESLGIDLGSLNFTITYKSRNAMGDLRAKVTPKEVLFLRNYEQIIDHKSAGEFVVRVGLFFGGKLEQTWH